MLCEFILLSQCIIEMTTLNIVYIVAIMKQMQVLCEDI
jgi:hypothetical protein